MQHVPQPHEIYRHFKGNTYQIVTIAEHSETGEMLVVYQAMYGDYKIYARPLNMFMEKVNKFKHPQTEQEYRFELQNNTPLVKQSADEGGKDNTAEDGSINEKSDDKEPEETESQEEAPNLDPLVVEFLDADTYEERLNILTGLHHRITDDMINVMAMATDIEVKQGDIEERFGELKNCLLKLEKYECNRLR